MGLKEQIEQANSEQQIADLLTKGEGYKLASNKTQRAWKRAATERTAFLRAHKALHFKSGEVAK